MKPSEWAESYQMLSRVSDAKGGKFHNWPWQKEPADQLIEPDVQGVVMQWAAQRTGKTTVVNNAIAYFIQHRPRPSLSIHATERDAETWSKDRLSHMLRDVSVLRGLVRDAGSRLDGPGSTMLHKTFPGGHLTILGANAPSGLRSRPIGFLIGEEIDTWEPSSGREGDPWALAIVRMEGFPDAVWMMTSTPLIKGLSRIEKEMEHSDKRFWFVPCYHCSKPFVMMWAHVKWAKDNPESACIECPECSRTSDDKQRIDSVWAGQWKPTAPFHGIRGYTLNGIVVLQKAHRGFKNRLHEMAVSFLKAKKGGPQTLKVWTNTFLAETWEEESDKPTAPEVLYARREDYGTEDSTVLPERCVVLSVGADVQADRIEAEISGWGEGEESWGIEYHVFRGNISNWAIWNEFDAWIQSRFKHVSGHELQPAVVAIDSGHNSKMVYAFAQRCAPRAVIAVRGVGAGGMPWVTGSKTRHRLKLAKVNTAKEIIYSRLKLIDHGPGYCHFPETYTLEWFQQLTSERMVTRYKSGIPERHFEENGRNEALDARVYAMAGLEIIRPNYKKLAARLKAAAPEVEPVKLTAEEARIVEQKLSPKAPVNQILRKMPRKPGGWMRM